MGREHFGHFGELDMTSPSRRGACLPGTGPELGVRIPRETIRDLEGSRLVRGAPRGVGPDGPAGFVAEHHGPRIIDPLGSDKEIGGLPLLGTAEVVHRFLLQAWYSLGSV